MPRENYRADKRRKNGLSMQTKMCDFECGDAKLFAHYAERGENFSASRLCAYDNTQTLK